MEASDRPGSSTVDAGPTSAPGCPTTSSPGWSSPRSSSRSGWATRRPLGCRRSPACTRPSSRCSSTPCSGPSRILVLGPDSSLAAIIAATIVPLAAGDQERAIALAGGLALISGAFGIAFGLLHLGLLDGPALEADPDRLSQRHRPDRLRRPAAQAVRLLGRRGRAAIAEAQGFVEGVRAARPCRPRWVGVLALAIMLIARWLGQGALGIFGAAVVTTIVTAVLGLAAAGVDVVGALPQGLPRLSVPAVVDRRPAGDAGRRIRHRRRVARRHERPVADVRDARRAAGRPGPGAHRARGREPRGGLSTPASRSARAPRARRSPRRPAARPSSPASSARWPSSRCSLFAPGLTTDLPQPTLAAIVIVACISLVDIGGLRRLIGACAGASPCCPSCASSASPSRRRGRHLHGGRSWRSGCSSGGRGGRTRRSWDGSRGSRATTT